MTQIREAANELAGLAQTSLVSLERCRAPSNTVVSSDDIATAHHDLQQVLAQASSYLTTVRRELKHLNSLRAQGALQPIGGAPPPQTQRRNPWDPIMVNGIPHLPDPHYERNVERAAALLDYVQQFPKLPPTLLRLIAWDLEYGTMLQGKLRGLTVEAFLAELRRPDAGKVGKLYQIRPEQITTLREVLGIVVDAPEDPLTT
jgi:hypothetical protein